MVSRADDAEKNLHIRQWREVQRFLVVRFAKTTPFACITSLYNLYLTSSKTVVGLLCFVTKNRWNFRLHPATQ